MRRKTNICSALLTFSVVCLSVGVRVQRWRSRKPEAVGSLEVELEVVVSHLPYVLGTKRVCESNVHA